jgi:hypothetical protein
MVVTFYNILDILFLLIILIFSYISYQHKIYIKIFEYFRVFIIFTTSAKLSSYTALYLQKFYITKADTYTTLILIAFGINLAIAFYSWKYLFKILNYFINSDRLRKLFAKFFTLLEVFILATFIFYSSMQLYVSKKYIAKIVYRTYTYPKIKKFYNSFLNDDFVNMVLSSDTGTNHKEIIFKSLKNAINF